MPTRAAPATEGPILPALMRLAVPIVLANLLQTGYQLTDAFWVGRLGAAAVAAVAVSFPITFLMIAIGGGLGVAGATLTAQYFGARDQAMVNHVAAQTMLMVIGVSVVLGALGFVLAPLILHMLGVMPEVYAEALGFLRVSFIGLIFVFAFAMFQALMRGVGRAAAPLYIVIATVVLNFALDPLFIFGWGPIPGAGIMGAAMATLSTQALATLVALVLLLRGTYGIAITPRGLVPDFAYIRRAFLLGFPASIELSARALGLIVMSLLVAGFGTVTLAAYGVGSNVLQVVTIPALGLSTAAAALVGQNIGAGRLDRAARITWLAAVLGFVVLTMVGLAALAAAPAVVRFFVPGEPAVEAEGVAFLRASAPAWGFIALQLAIVSTFRASGNMLAAMVLALVSQWVLQFPFAYALSRPQMLGTAGLWWSFPITNLVTAAVAWVWYARGDWCATRLTAVPPGRNAVTDEVMVEDRRA
ncbi:MAG: MATE family efflux transporter [Janthinobacterium lividum]